MRFEKIIRYEQKQLKAALKDSLNSKGYEVICKDGFLYAKGDIPVLLVAHLDTVHFQKVKNIFYSEDKSKIMSPEGIGGDDRCGVFMIMEILKTHKCSVLFCEDEEVGGVGAKKFTNSGIKIDVNYIIEFDRTGDNDAVFYDCDNPEFTKFICDNGGFVEEYGSFSDISFIAPHTGIAAVNLSSGYYNAHMRYEYIDINVVMNNIERAKKIISTESEAFKYIEGTKYGTYNYSYNKSYSYYSDYDYDYSGYSYGSSYLKNKYSSKEKQIYVSELCDGEYIICDDGSFLDSSQDYLYIDKKCVCYRLNDDVTFIEKVNGTAYTASGLPKRWTIEDEDGSYLMPVKHHGENNITYLTQHLPPKADIYSYMPT